MHPCDHAQTMPDKAAYIMAATGETVTYKQLNDRSNQAAHLFRACGLRRGDAIAIFMENNARYLELCWAAQRAGLYFTCISTRLTAGEVDYIVGDCGAKLFVTSAAMGPLLDDLAGRMPGVAHRFIIGGTSPGYTAYEPARDQLPTDPIADESAGTDMLYSSGTTGRPKGIKAALPETPINDVPPLLGLVTALYGAGPTSVYLSPAPLYHAAPLRYNMAMHRVGATSVVMEHFDAEEALKLIDRHNVTISQWVPTMFIRMLKLPESVRTAYDLSSHACAIHAAAPCPVAIKEQMIAWWGPIINEYYAGTEGNGFCAISSAEWLAHKGSVGRALMGEIHIVGEDGAQVAPGEVGTIYFGGGNAFEYHNDPDKTAESRHPEGWTTLGDVGRVDEDGYLYLTDRKAHMIISGGVNIYPQEAENLLVTHPKVADVAVIGVPNEDFGEEVKAVVQPVNWEDHGPELEAELIAFCQSRLAKIKCPRTVAFDRELPRHPTGKLYKRLVRDRYWGNRDSKIV